VSNAVECADRIIHLLGDGDQARAIGVTARDTVRRRFLMPRLLLDYIRLFQHIADEEFRQPERCSQAEAEAACGLLTRTHGSRVSADDLPPAA